MTKDILKNSILAGVSVLFIGCYGLQPRRQKAWHEGVIRVHSEAGLSVSKRADLMSSEQIETLIGEPDFKGPPGKLEGLLEGDESYRSKVFTKLWHDYCLAKRKTDPSGFDCPREPARWRDCGQFNVCSFWLYDESEHFRKPIVWGWGVHVGFSCYCFFVEQGRVVGVSCMTHWRPLNNE
jgi:hypothetical protein